MYCELLLEIPGSPETSPLHDLLQPLRDPDPPLSRPLPVFPSLPAWHRPLDLPPLPPTPPLPPPPDPLLPLQPPPPCPLGPPSPPKLAPSALDESECDLLRYLGGLVLRDLLTCCYPAECGGDGSADGLQEHSGDVFDSGIGGTRVNHCNDWD